MRETVRAKELHKQHTDHTPSTDGLPERKGERGEVRI